ncbi:glycosyltransferase family 2 protein [Treponema bryantii]|uniref:glycosyltransferase family 2 protein n=1 Tax=Treponema bryantii TaxID=163 RepID=UPI000944DF25|nr:glycosyltransferase family 2 protein [Treponema bryantii]
MKTIPHISVCIPLYGTEPLLAQCLRSVFLQDFDSFEVIVLSDASLGKDEKGRNGRKITKHVLKECKKIRKENGLAKISVRFIEHRENMGLVEVRRSLIFYAQGKYISYIDSDDVMVQGALKTLYETAENQSADIVQGHSTAGNFDASGNFIPADKNIYSNITIGSVCGHGIQKNWLTNGSIAGVLWAKLYKRALLEKAFESIPHIECNMAEDFLISFFTTFYAEKYVGIENPVYQYRAQSGMSSKRKIDSLKKIRMVCSTASVFAVISQSEELKTLDENEVNCVRRFSTYYLKDNIKQLQDNVIPELKNIAHEILCEYWGESFVNRVEASMKKQ